MRKVVFAGVAGALLIGSQAGAADLKAGVVDSYRWYVEARLGAPIRQDYDVTIGGGIGPGTYTPSTGWHGALAVGAQLNPNWRAELAFGYTTGRNGNVSPFGPHTGSTSVYSFLVNGYYTFTSLSPSFQPFIGAGVGMAIFDVNNLGLVGGAFVINDSDTTLAAALHVGVDVPLTNQIIFTGRYSLAYTGSVSFAGPPGSTTTRGSAADHIFSAGVRVFLN